VARASVAIWARMSGISAWTIAARNVPFVDREAISLGSRARLDAAEVEGDATDVSCVVAHQKLTLTVPVIFVFLSGSLVIVMPVPKIVLIALVSELTFPRSVDNFCCEEMVSLVVVI